MEFEACRLCLEKIMGDKYVSLEDFEKNMLETLIPIISMNLCCDTKMCDRCSQMLQASYDFKAVCLANNERLKKLLILKEVCQESNCKSCCLCGDAILEELNDEGKIDWKEMVEKCIPELDIYSSDDLSACEKCLDYLKDVYKFVERCLETEQAIRSYSSSISENSKDPIKLSDIIKIKDPSCTVSNNTDVLEQEQSERVSTSENCAGNEGAQEAERHDAVSHVPPVQPMQSEESSIENFADTENDSVVTDKGGTVTEVQPNSCLEERSVNTKEVEPNLANEANNSTEAKPQENIENFEENVECPEENSIECVEEDIPGQKRKERSRSKKYKCDKCSYEARHKSALVSHWMSHKDPSETTMFKCHECDHETKRKGDLRAHMIIHKNPLELKMFKCPECPYESKRKGDLKQHSMVHITHKYKCKLCPFETNNEAYLNTLHALVHKEKSEIKMYQCEFCPYKAKTKGHLNLHAKLHKSTSEVPMFKCNWCDFETRYKTGLINHLILHKCPSEITMFVCHMCGFEAKRKADIRNHIQRHNKFRSPMYQCDSCPFETTDKRYLKKHQLMHKDPSEVQMYECELCTYQSRRRAYVKTHMLTHIRAARAEHNYSAS